MGGTRTEGERGIIMEVLCKWATDQRKDDGEIARKINASEGGKRSRGIKQV